ncbi:MAG: GTP cyclohydrolase FolE2 [Methylacidiphilales bacterium]|nr:GTP cyclohydrolase FolE2 [Candidatus Methylacidiphilales bacterium]MDW8349449.1 GTP cyclohydrolase FolE2 [Verrucomicrobiae bacterium]
MSKDNAANCMLADRQNERDYREIAIDRVGIKDLLYPIAVRDLSQVIQHTVARVEMTVDLPHHYKGTHMSRFVEILHSHGREIQADQLFPIVHSLRTRLDASAAHLILDFPYFIEKKAPVTESRGLVDYGVTFVVTHEDGRDDFVLKIRVPLTTLCPCSKAISAYGAHNQRGYVTVAIRSRATVWIEELVKWVESCGSAEVFSLLKRADEKRVTELAYDHPVFVEDLVRNVALKLNSEPRVTAYQIEAENIESIHNHSAYALVKKAWY